MEGTLIAAPSTLDIFTIPPTQYAIQNNLTTEHRPIATINSGSVITFIINTSSDEYVNLKDLLLRVKLRVNIKKADGTTPATSDWTQISPVNYLMHSLFKQVTLEINGKQVTVSPQTYPYKAMFESIIGFTNDAKTSYLTASGYFKDSTSNPEVIDTTRNSLINPGKAEENGKTIELLGKPHIDFAFQERALIGGSKIKIELTPHDPSFYLRADTTKVSPSVEFLDASLFINRSKVSPLILEAHNKALMKGNARYPICRNEVKTFSISTGTLSASIDNIVNGQIPRRAFVAMVTNDAFNGSYSKNPFNFQHFNCNFISTYIDGVQYPSIPFTPDFKEGLYTREYLGFFEAVNQLTTDSTISITKQNYIKGNTIFGFNYAQDFSNSCIQEGHANPIKRGSMGLQLRFSETLTQTINILVYLEYDNLIQIDSDRQTFTDYI